MHPHRRPTHDTPSTSPPRQADTLSPSYASPLQQSPQYATPSIRGTSTAANSVASLSSLTSGGSTATQKTKAEQIIQHFYSKAAQVIVQSRWTHSQSAHTSATARRPSRREQGRGSEEGPARPVLPRRVNKWVSS